MRLFARTGMVSDVGVPVHCKQPILGGSQASRTRASACWSGPAPLCLRASSSRVRLGSSQEVQYMLDLNQEFRCSGKGWLEPRLEDDAQGDCTTGRRRFVPLLLEIYAYFARQQLKS